MTEEISNQKFERLLKKSAKITGKFPMIFRLNDDFLWTDYHMIIKDSIGLCNYFGNYILNKCIEKGYVCVLNPFDSPIIIADILKKDENYFQHIKNLFNEDTSKNKILSSPLEAVCVKNPFWNVEQRLLFVDGSSDTVRVDNQYLDYIKRRYEISTIYQGVNDMIGFKDNKNNTIAILMPILKKDKDISQTQINLEGRLITL